jgi:SanA protein
VALVLGAGLTANGTLAWFLADRLDAAIRLYRVGKVDGLLMSRDNHTASHDEPTAMRAYAIAHGAPAAAITLDADVTTPSPRYLGAHEQLRLQPAAAGAG